MKTGLMSVAAVALVMTATAWGQRGSDSQRGTGNSRDSQPPPPAQQREPARGVTREAPPPTPPPSTPAPAPAPSRPPRVIERPVEAPPPPPPPSTPAPTPAPSRPPRVMERPVEAPPPPPPPPRQPAPTPAPSRPPQVIEQPVDVAPPPTIIEVPVPVDEEPLPPSGDVNLEPPVPVETDPGVASAVLTECMWNPQNAGYDFSEHEVCYYARPSSDISFGYRSGQCFFDVSVYGAIVDLGYSDRVRAASLPPAAEWSQAHRARVIADHLYFLRTADDERIFLLVRELSPKEVLFSWRQVPQGVAIPGEEE